MALRPLNSVGGFSVGEIPANVILANADITANKGTFVGNVAISNTNPAYGILTDNLYYSNGQPWDLQEAAGSNTQIQFNNNNNFGASANLTFDNSTNTFTVLGNANLTTVNTTNVDSAGNLFLTANGYTLSLYANGLAEFEDGVLTTGNLTVGNANLGNAVVANFITVNSNLLAGNANIGNGNIDLYANGEIAASTANFSGNVYAAYFVGNVEANITITAPNTTVLYSSNGLVQGSNNFTFNYSNNYLLVNGNANIVGNTSVGGILTDNYYYANGSPVDFQQAAGSNNEIQFNSNDDFAASANLTFDPTTSTFTVTGNANVTTLNTSNVVGGGTDVTINANGYVSTFYGANGLVTLPSALTANGNLQVNNANLGNLAIANFVNVASNLHTVNANVTGTLEVANANIASNLTVNNLTVNLTLNGNVANFTGNLTAANAALGNLVTANYVNVANDLNVVGNINASNLVGLLANGSSNVAVDLNSNVRVGIAGTANILQIGNIGILSSVDIESTLGNIRANGNLIANGTVNGANANITGEVKAGSVLTANITAPTGNITINAAGSDENIILAPTGNGVVTVGLHRITQVLDPQNPNDAATKEYVDSTSQGLTIHTAVRVTSVTNLTATYANGGSVLTTIAITGGTTIQFSAAHGLSVGDELAWDNSFNGIVGNDPYFVFSTPAADTITVKAGYFGAQVTTLTNGTSLSQTARANTGVGATLTNAGANAALSIDSIALASTNRVLVQGQTNQFENGIYTVTTVGNGSTAWVLTRATDEDTYSPTSTSALGYGDYFFVQEGSGYAGSSYVLTTPVGEILFGLTNIAFSQFSAAGAYSAGNGIAINGTIISANVDNDTTAIVSGNITVKVGANLVTPNLGDATFSSLTWNTLSNGNVTANNLSISNIANITANLTVGGNIQANGTISSNSNVSGLNLTTSGNVEASGNVLANNLSANTLLTTPTANVSNVVNAGNVSIVNNLSGNTANFSGNVTVPNLTVNLELAGNSANFSGNVYANYFVGNVSGNFTVTAGNTEVLFSNAGLVQGSSALTFDFGSNVLTANGIANVIGNVNAGNLVTAGTANVAVLNVTGNVTSDLLPNANLTHDLGNSTLRWDNVYAGNLDVASNITIAGNILSSTTVEANTVIANTVIEVGNTAIYWGTVTTTSITGNQTISSVPVTGITGVEWIVKATDSLGAKHSMAIVTAVTDGANADYSTFGTVNLGSSTGTLAVNIVGSNLALQVTPASSNSTVWTTQYRTI